MMAFCDLRLTVGVCDTQPVVIEGLRTLLAGTGVYRLLDPSKTLEALTETIVALSPRAVLVDKALGSAEVADWLSRIRTSTSTSVVIWGPNFNESEALRFLQAGAKGVLRKTAALESFTACLDAVCNGAVWMDDNLFQAAGGLGVFGRTELTAREHQVLELVEQGLRNKEIASELGIRPGTVKIHLKHIFEKSGVHGRHGLALSGFRDRYAPEAVSA